MFDVDHKSTGMDFAEGRLDSRDPYSRLEKVSGEKEQEQRNPLDSPQMVEQHRHLLGIYQDELDRQSDPFRSGRRVRAIHGGRQRQIQFPVPALHSSHQLRQPLRPGAGFIERQTSGRRAARRAQRAARRCQK